MPALLLLLAHVFMAPGLPPAHVAAPMSQVLLYPPWHTAHPDLAFAVKPAIAGGDLLLQQLPWRHWMQQELAAGRFPLWASGPLGGVPLFANYQTGVLYPLHLLWALLPIGPASGIIMALKLWLAGLGMWWFLRALKLSRAAATLSSVGFMFSTWMVDWLPWENSGVSLLAPWLAWAIYAWCAEGRRLALAGLAGLIACAILAGHAETLFIVAVIVGLWALGLILARPWRHWPRLVAGLVVAATLGAAFGAMQLLAFFEVLPLSLSSITRAPAAIAARVHLDASMMLDWILPRFWGDPADIVTGGRESFVVANAYMGLIALLGMLLAGVSALWRRVRFSLLLPWAAIVLVSWVIAYDDRLGVSIRILPGLNQIITQYWVGAIAFSGLVVSAIGWDSLGRWQAAEGHMPGWRPGRAWSGAGLVLLAEGAAVLIAQWLGFVPGLELHDKIGPWFTVTSSYQQYWGVWAGGLVLAGLGLAALWVAPGRARHLVPVALVVLVLVDLWRLVLPLNGTAPAADYYPETSFLRQVQEVMPPTERLLVEGDAFPANTALIYGIRDWRGQDPMTSVRAFNAAHLLSPKLTSNLWDLYNMFLRDVRLPIAPLLGMRYYVFPADIDPNRPTTPDPGRPTFTRLVYKEGLGLWRAEDMPGFAYLSDHITAVGTEHDATVWMQGMTWDRLRAMPALVEAAPAAVTTIRADSAGGAPGTRSVLDYTPGHIRIRAETTRPALLVVAESWYPGWQATLDGQPTAILRANYLSQGVVVPAGSHVLAFDYAPAWFSTGLALAGVGILGLALLGLWAWRASRAAP